jgi:hypothetical protein
LELPVLRGGRIVQQMIAPRAVDIPLAKIQVDFGAAD